jgi:hypothetical protein
MATPARTHNLSADPAEIERTIALLLRPGDVIECRIPKTEREGTVSGYFDDAAALKKAVLSRNGDVGIYLTLNPCKPELLARCVNRLKTRAKVTTADKDILCRRRLLLDFDAVRPSDISSSDEEHAAALARTKMAAVTLVTDCGWPAAVLGDSGNGGHLIFGLPDLPNDEASTRLLEGVLKALAMRFDDAAVKLDTAVYNAARITKCYGTVSRKGDHLVQRPHRLSRMIEMLDTLEPVTLELLKAMAATIEPPKAKTSPPPPRSGVFNPDQFIARYINAREPVAHDGGGRKWVLEECPFNADHKAPDAAIFQQADGTLGFNCFHSSCSNKGWRDVRELFEGPRQHDRAEPPPRDEGPQAEASDDWPDPEPLQGELPPVQAFNPVLLPESLRGHAVDVAERMQVPLDFVAAFEVLCLAGAVNRRATSQPKAIDSSWIVTPNLWGGAVADSGLKKSPTLKAVVRPLEKIQAKWHQDYASELENYARDNEEQELRLAAWREQYKAARKAGKPDPIRPDDSLPEPKLRRLILNDATYEKLHEVMHENPSGVLVVRDELTGWLAQLERQGREGEREFSLQAWNGDTGHAIDRIGRGTLYVPHCCMSLMGGIQPDRLRSYLADVMAGGPTNDGLMQRFQVLVWPDISRNLVYVDRLPDFDAEQRVARVFQTLVDMDGETAECLRFTADAQELFIAWLVDLETRLASGELHGALASHLSKYRSLMPSLALLFEWADAAANGQRPTCVSLAHARQAAEWCDYLESHARRVYSCIVTPQFRAAQVLSEKIKQKKVGTDGIFSVREVYLKGWSGLDTKETAAAAADVLEDAGWVRSLESKSPDPLRRGRPANRYQINPKVWS